MTDKLEGKQDRPTFPMSRGTTALAIVIGASVAFIGGTAMAILDDPLRSEKAQAVFWSLYCFTAPGAFAGLLVASLVTRKWTWTSLFTFAFYFVLCLALGSAVYIRGYLRMLWDRMP
jgi:hypothetical protein